MICTKKKGLKIQSLFYINLQKRYNFTTASVSDFLPKLILEKSTTIGEAINIDEYEPKTTPHISTNENPFNTSPPKKYKTTTTKNTVIAVIIVLLKVLLIAKLIVGAMSDFWFSDKKLS